MPLFGSSRRQPSPVRDTHYVDRDDANSTPDRKGSIFSRNRGTSRDKRSSLDETNNRAYDRDLDHQQTNGHSTGGGFFSRSSNRRSSSDDERMSRDSSGSFGTSRSGSRLTRGNGKVSNDPAVLGARQKVSDAEDAERQADRALIEARNAVHEARQHVKELERDVEMEARMAKLKQQEAKSVSKSAKGLGRHM